MTNKEVLFPIGCSIRVELDNGKDFTGELIKTDLESKKIVLKNDIEIAMINLEQVQAIVRVLSKQEQAEEVLNEISNTAKGDYVLFNEELEKYTSPRDLFKRTKPAPNMQTPTKYKPAYVPEDNDLPDYESWRTPRWGKSGVNHDTTKHDKYTKTKSSRKAYQ